MIKFLSNGGYKSFLFNTVTAMLALGSGSVVGIQLLHNQQPTQYAVGYLIFYTGFAVGKVMDLTGIGDKNVK